MVENKTIFLLASSGTGLGFVAEEFIETPIEENTAGEVERVGGVGIRKQIWVG